MEVGAFVSLAASSIQKELANVFQLMSLLLRSLHLRRIVHESARIAQFARPHHEVAAILIDFSKTHYLLIRASLSTLLNCFRIEYDWSLLVDILCVCGNLLKRLFRSTKEGGLSSKILFLGISTFRSRIFSLGLDFSGVRNAQTLHYAFWEGCMTEMFIGRTFFHGVFLTLTSAHTPSTFDRKLFGSAFSIFHSLSLFFAKSS